MSDLQNVTTKQRQNLDSSFKVSLFQSRDFGVQQKLDQSAPATQAELWENYQQTKQLNQKGGNSFPSQIKAKLIIGQPGDKYEQEADSVADRVMAMSEPGLATSTVTNSVQNRSIQSIQKVSTDSTEDALSNSDLESRLNSSKGSGSPLTNEIRGFMEPRFGADFSGVRVHTGTDAVQMNRDVNAQAFAHGRDIYFGAGKAPGKDALTAHELTHVVQQTNVVSPNVSRPLSMDALAKPTAEQVSDTVMSDQSDGHMEQGDGLSVQCQLFVTAKPPDNKGFLARRPAPSPDSVEFRVGTEIGPKLVNAAKKIAVGGVTKDELKGLRSVALSDDTIDHEERGFLAGLLDSANAAKVAGGGTSFVFTKASIDAHLAEVSDLERPQLDEAVATAFNKKWMSVAAGEPDEVEKHVHEEEDAALVQIARLVGKSRENKLRSVVAYAAAHGVKTPELLTATIAGTSDSTADDMLMAATVYAVAAAINHELQYKLLSGTIKIDRVPKAQLDGNDAMYSTEGIGKSKGDTIYVPESLSIDNTAHRSAIVHELEHAVQDRSASNGLIRVEAELGAYRAQARYLLDRIAPLQGAERDAAIDQTAKIANNGFLTPALILESRRDRDTSLSVIFDINSKMPANVRLGFADLQAWIAMDDVALMVEAKAAILKSYNIVARDIGSAAGFRGEHDTNRM